MKALVLGFVFFAMAVRVAHWPGLHEIRDGDELGYSWGSLQVLEGNLPGIHYSPAGPQTWAGWAYESAVSLKRLLLPNANTKAAPLQVRPFLAVDDAVFDAYRDTGALRQVWVVTSFLSSLVAVLAASRFGYDKGKTAGLIFLGGAVAFWPLFVDFSVQARPYIAAWSFGIVALYYSLASSHRNARVFSAIAMGIAVGSRVDMLMLLPLIWSHDWQSRATRPWVRRVVMYHVILFLSFLVVAPWYLTTLVACLRAIATIRGSTVGFPVITAFQTLFQLVWTEGLLFYILFFVAGVGLWLVTRPKKWLLGVYLILIGASFFKGAAFGLRYQGAALVLMLFVGTYAIGYLGKYSRKLALVLGCAALIIPAAHTVQLIVETRQNYVPDRALQWVETHVPPGTIVYVRPWITNLLPTAEAADAGWDEVTDRTAYRKKFEQGLGRFQLQTQEVPRALSDVNLALERANRRFIFILGGHQGIKAPRFDMRVFETGPVFGVQKISEAFRESGGVLILRGPGTDPICQAMGAPTIAWLNRRGEGARVYCSAGVALLNGAPF